MPTSDNDNQSAVKKAVDAFRARRAGDDDATPAAVPEDDGAETSVVRIEPGQSPGGGGDSESPTKAFAIPVVEQATEETTVVTDEPAEGSDVEDSAEAGDASSFPTETVVTVAGSGDRAQAPARTAVEAVDPDSVTRPEIVEHTVDLTEADADAQAEDTQAEAAPAADDSETAVIAAQAPAEAEDDAPEAVEDSTKGTVESSADVTPTEKIELPTAAVATTAAAGAAAAAGAPAKPAEQQAWSSTPHQPQVIPGAQPQEPKKRRGRLMALGALLVAAIIAVAAVLIWYFMFDQSTQNKVADAARSYQNAMSDGDLEALRDITCGEEYQYYSKVSPEEFAKAFQAQKAQNQMMKFKDITGVAVDGDTARVGVDVYNSGDPKVTTSAQITLHKVDGSWKVCDQP
ncbi:DUF4878 domain-containing protein [Gordonia sp. PP30]|uniref:Rv0361 family membrane protein n=1 Tax=unclassified Gordonia (in: high G+C Gram-positive bacteria) TaxID=2657482 RepID=UPI001FFFDEEC|nr:DUF4878 domain-containing protein [Gordonia sp. PP30]UQE75498.1 DUF4878 domain-containing protein [Gordonia sp. PP30]